MGQIKNMYVIVQKVENGIRLINNLWSITFFFMEGVYIIIVLCFLVRGLIFIGSPIVIPMILNKERRGTRRVNTV